MAQLVQGQQVDLAKHPSGIVPQIQNVVATVTLGCELDLKCIALAVRSPAPVCCRRETPATALEKTPPNPLSPLFVTSPSSLP